MHLAHSDRTPVLRPDIDNVGFDDDLVEPVQFCLLREKDTAIAPVLSMVESLNPINANALLIQY